MLRQFKIGKRLSVGFGILVLISIIVGVSAYLRLTDIQGNLNNISERRLPAALLVGDMNREFLLQRVATANWLADSDAANASGYQSAIEKAQRAYNEASDQAANFHKTPAGRATFEKVLAAKTNYDKVHQQLLTMLAAGQASEAKAFEDDRFESPPIN